MLHNLHDCTFKDTADFINKLENVIDRSKVSILVTLGLKALYTNIPNHEGIEDVKETPNNQAKKPIATRVIINFLYLISIQNNFVISGINYLQKTSCAMGKVCAPAYGNISTGKFEKLHIYRYPNNFLTFYCRFIDDIFFLWNGTESELIQFIDNLNQKHPTIKFEFTYSRTSITFLDTKAYINENGTLCTTIYGKPSHSRNFLHYKSMDPKVLKDSLPYSEALRIKQISSKTSGIIKHLKDLTDAFIKKGVTNLKF